MQFLLQPPIHQDVLDAWLPLLEGAEELAKCSSMCDGKEQVVSPGVQEVQREDARMAREWGARMRLQGGLILHNYLARNLFKIRSISSHLVALKCPTECDK